MNRRKYKGSRTFLHFEHLTIVLQQIKKKQKLVNLSFKSKCSHKRLVLNSESSCVFFVSPSSVQSTPLVSCKWWHHKESRLRNTPLLPYRTGEKQLDKKNKHNLPETQETQSKDEKKTHRNTSTAQMQKDPRQNFEKAERGNVPVQNRRGSIRQTSCSPKPQPERISHREVKQ